MKRIFTILSLFVTIHLTGQDTDFDSLYFTSNSGLRLPYRSLQPAQQEAGKKYPLVIFLHGAGERGDDNRAQLIHGATLFSDYKNRLAYPAFVFFPQCRKDSYWATVDVDRSGSTNVFNFDYDTPITDDLQAVIELIKYYRKEFPVDKKRIYVLGLSMGGMGTFQLVNHLPKMFAAALPICGGADVDSYSRKSRKTAFWIFHGDADAVVPVDLSRQMNTRLKSLGHDVRYSEYPGVNHGSWNNAFAEPDFLKWIFSQRR